MAPGQRAVEDLRFAIEALEVTLWLLGPPRRPGRRGDWRTHAVEVIRGDLVVVVAAGVPVTETAVAEVERLADRAAGLRRRHLRGGSQLAAGEAVLSLRCAAAAVEQAIRSRAA